MHREPATMGGGYESKNTGVHQDCGHPLPADITHEFAEQVIDVIGRGQSSTTRSQQGPDPRKRSKRGTTRPPRAIAGALRGTHRGHGDHTANGYTIEDGEAL